MVFHTACLVIFLWLQVDALCNNSIPLEEYLSLHSLFSSTNGNSWCADHHPGRNWNFSSDFPSLDICTAPWKGISCGCDSISNNYSVIAINLTASCLSGPLPYDISKLVNLSSLYFNGDWLTGKIPTTISSLSNLEAFDVDSCFFTGSIPAEFGFLTKLSYLSLLFDQFTGSVPNTLSNLINLRLFGVGSAYFDAPIPSFVYSCTQLTLLYIMYFSFSNSIISNDISKLENLESLTLYGYSISGSLPSGFYSLSNLQYLSISTDTLSGSISEEVSNLVNLEYFYFMTDVLVGSIPWSFGNLTQLNYFLLDSPLLTGVFPSSFSNLVRLNNLQIFSNSILGSIPDIFENMSLLQGLSFFFNSPYLTGTLPSSLFSLSNVIMMNILGPVSGTISPQISRLQSLSVLEIIESRLFGSIPDEICTLHFLSTISLVSTQINGSIPNCLTLMNNLGVIYIDSSTLSGTLPDIHPGFSALHLRGGLMSSSIPTCYFSSSLFYLNLTVGYLYSSLPSDVLLLMPQLTTLSISGGLTGKLPIFGPQLRQLILSHNSLTGTVPISFSTSNSLSALLMSNNFLEGPILSLLDQNPLETLDLSFNLFDGTFPESLHEEYLRLLYLGNNGFSGTLPSIMFSEIRAIELQHNRFSGTINPYFLNGTFLQNVDLSDNLFSGQMPQELFLLPFIQVFSAIDNCFSGSIVSSLVCSARDSLESILIDGLTSNQDCPANIRISKHLPFFIKGFIQSKYMVGSIPDCLWQMPHLQTFHASGNGFSGTFPSSGISKNLIDVSVSNNRMSGTIPDALQHHKFSKQFVLSNNRFVGRLVSDFLIANNQTSLTLSVNRLSGRLPLSLENNAIQSLANLTNLNILSGNLFQCQGSKLPQKDPYYLSYFCGSQSMYESMETVAALVGLAVVLFLVSFYVHKRKNDIQSSMKDFSDAIEKMEGKRKESTQLAKFLITYDVVKKYSLPLMIFIIVVASSVYTGLKSSSLSYRTVYDQYGWTISAAYIQDWPIVVFLIVVVLMWIGCFIVDVEHLYDKIANENGYDNLDPRLFRFYGIFIPDLENKRRRQSSRRIDIEMSKEVCNPIAIDVIHSYSNSEVISIEMVSPNPHSLDSTSINRSSSEHNTSSFEIPPNFHENRMNSDQENLSSIHSSHQDILVKPPSSPMHHELFLLLLRIVLFWTNIIVMLAVIGSFLVTIQNDSTLSHTKLFLLQYSLALFKVVWNKTYVPISLNLMKLHIRGNMRYRLFSMLFNFIGAPILASLVAEMSCFYYVFVPAGNITSSFSNNVCTNYQLISGQMMCISYELRYYSTTYTPPFLYSFQCSSSILTIYAPVLVYAYSITGIVEPMIQFLFLVNPDIWMCFRKYIQCLISNLPLLRVKLDITYTFDEFLLRLHKGPVILVGAMLHITILLTFGLSFPVLAVLVGSAIAINGYLWNIVLGLFVNKSINQILLDTFVENSWMALHSCLTMCVVTIGLFWGFFIFDMIGNIYGTTFGLLFGFFFAILPGSLLLCTRMYIGYQSLRT